MIIENRDPVRKVNRAALGMLGAESERGLPGRTCHNCIGPTGAGKRPVLDLPREVDFSPKVLLDRAGNRIPILKSVSRINLGEEALLETFLPLRSLAGSGPA